MTVPNRIKRSTGSAAPVSLLNAEISYSEGVAGGGTLFIGVGTGGAGGSATSIVAIGGPSVYASKTYVDSSVSSVDVTSQLASYLTIATAASTYLTVSSASSTYLTQSAASTTYATINSPTFTGVPAAVTAAGGDNSTKIATTAFVASAISALVNGAPGVMDTLKEISDSLAADPNFAATISTSLSAKLVKASNLSDLTSVSDARTNLGLGSMALQNSSSVSITGGTIDGVVIDGGSYP